MPVPLSRPVAPGPLPRYLQVAETLARDIAAGRLADGARLPPERRLAVDLGVAVGTLRQALAELTDRGLLRRVQGSGNYVRARAGAPLVYAFFRLELLSGGGLPTAEVLAVDRVDAPAGAGQRIRRLRRLSGAPSAIEEIRIDAARVPDLGPADLSEALYLTLAQRFGLVAARVEDRVGQGVVPDWAPAAFAPAPGTPVPRVERVTAGPDGRVFETSATWIDPAVATYVNRMGG